MAAGRLRHQPKDPRQVFSKPGPIQDPVSLPPGLRLGPHGPQRRLLRVSHGVWAGCGHWAHSRLSSSPRYCQKHSLTHPQTAPTSFLASKASPRANTFSGNIPAISGLLHTHGAPSSDALSPRKPPGSPRKVWLSACLPPGHRCFCLQRTQGERLQVSPCPSACVPHWEWGR